MKKVSKLDEYLFDLNGYLIIENALTKKEPVSYTHLRAHET